MSRALRSGLLLSALVAAGLAVPASAAEPVYEIESVPTVDGATLRVEILRDPTKTNQPVILTYSPYNTLAETAPADSARNRELVAKGYAVAVADVLGTRGSTGCWDYGGKDEQQSGADVVMHLANKSWSNGRVGMTGVSYEGTTANMVAALGDKISADSRPDGKGLAGIVPIAAISRWYGYAYGDGVRYLGNSRNPTDEGFDTPLAFDLGFGRTVPADPDRDPAGFAAALQARAAECGTAEHTQRGYSRTPDYDAFWQERDYRKDAASFRVPTMVVHGWQDYNVKQEEGTALFEAIPVDPAGKKGVPFKKLWMTQEFHADGTGTGYSQALMAFWDKTLKQVDNKIEKQPAVTTLTTTATGPKTAYTKFEDYSARGVTGLELNLRRSFDTVPGVPSAGVAGSTGENGKLTLAKAKPDDGGAWTHVDGAATTEEATLADPTNRSRDVQGQPVRSHGYGWLYHESAALTSDLRILGSAELRTTVTSTVPGQHLTPLLVEVLPNGTLELVQRGFLNLDYAKGLEKADSTAGTKTVTVRFLPQDYTFTKGSRIGLVLQGSNTVWAVPGAAGALSYDMTGAKGTTLVLPQSSLTAGVPLPE